MNLQDRDVELTWRQITCQRTVAGDVFSRGIQDFDFSVSGKNAFIPSLSYFIIEVDLSVVPTNAPRIVLGYNNGGVVDIAALPAGALPLRRPALADGIALADHFGSTLYNNAYFRAGNSDVSFIQQFIPQAGVVKSRLDKSFAWTKSIGRSVMMDDPDFERRRNYISLDGVFHDDGLKPKQYDRRRLLTNTYADASTFNAGVAFSVVTGLLTITPSNTVCNPMITGIRTGDILVVGVTTDSGAGTAPANESPYYFQVTVPETNFILNTAQNGAVSFLVTPLKPTLNIDAGSNAGLIACQVAHDPACGTNRVQVVYQPPIGIFSEANPISGGDFKVVLNPSPNFATAGVQSLSPLRAYQEGLREYDYKLDIRNVFFYVCQIKSDVSPTGIIPISLIEMAVLNKNMNPAASQSLDFTVPPSTLAITVFVQAGVAGTTTCLPSTKFLLADIDAAGTLAPNTFTELPIVSCQANASNDVQSIQVTYGSVTKTQTLYTSQYRNNSTEGVNYNIQRFLQSQQYSQKIISEGGSESHPQFLERGNMWHFDFSKDKNDTSSYVSVNIAFPQNVPAGSVLFIVAHYSRQCEISYENGFVTQVVSVNR